MLCEGPRRSSAPCGDWLSQLLQLSFVKSQSHLVHDRLWSKAWRRAEHQRQSTLASTPVSTQVSFPRQIYSGVLDSLKCGRSSSSVWIADGLVSILICVACLARVGLAFAALSPFMFSRLFGVFRGVIHLNRSCNLARARGCQALDSS